MSPDTQEQRSEEGIALISALLAVLVIGALAALMYSNAIFEVRSTATARDYETSIHTAEAGAEKLFQALIAGDAGVTVVNGPSFDTDEQERTWVLDQPKPADVVVTAQGEGYGIGPVEREGKSYVYGVGTEGTAERPRVVRTEILQNTSTPLFAGNGLLFGGDLEVTGSHTIHGDVHVDGDLQLNHCGFYVEGQATVAGTNNAAKRPGMTRPETPGGCWMPGNIVVSESPEQQVCRDDGYCHDKWRPPVSADGPAIPNLHAIDIHAAQASELGAQGSWFDMCRETVGGEIRGVVRYGAATPCTGEIEVVLRPSDYSDGNNDQWWHGQGWRYYDEGASDRLPNSWVKVSADSSATSAVYYMHHTNFSMKSGHSNLDMSYIVSADPDDTDGGNSGNANVAGGVQANRIPELGGDWAMFADRDLHSLTGGGGRTFDGNVYARGQIQWPGQSTVTGSIVSGNHDITLGSPINTSDLGGSSVFTYNEDYEPEGGSGDGAALQVFSWKEL